MSDNPDTPARPEDPQPVRIAFGRFMQETNAFSTVLTTGHDFARSHLIADQTLLKACEPNVWEVTGYLKNLELSGFMKAVNSADVAIQVVPLISAWAISGGPIARDFFEDMVKNFCKRLAEKGPVDAVYLALHGAMGVEGIKDPEVYFIEAIRKTAGNVPVAASFDLHANYTRAKHKAIDLCCTYHTNPHFDMARTGYKTGKLLIDYLKESVKPTRAWRSLPLLLAGGNTLSMGKPMRPLFQYIKQLEKRADVLSVNLFMCHPYLDHPEAGWAVNVITDNDQQLAETLADDLAERCWALRYDAPPEFLSVKEMLETVRKSRLARTFGAIAVCDTSDVVGAGGTGENTHLLKALLEEARDLVSLYPLRDPAAVQQLWLMNVGDTPTLPVGGKLQPEVNPALIVTGKILKKKQTEHFGKVVTLDLGSVKLVLTEGAALPMKPSFYEDMDLNVRAADMVITKNFFHFRLYYLKHCTKTLYVKTYGITDLDRIMELDLPYPAYPKDDIVDWRAIDAHKRRVPAVRPEHPAPVPQKPRSKWGLLLTLFGVATLAHVAYHQENSLTFWRKRK